ncbi:HdeA/HdeB family chaperone [Roseiarcaceae bacterium H3SJ34-1]|uniref:HdeA/HdeB family chaperone n=1 Tax=Terripilifer ovatus TaxID=3032367 RepID=UPI003AB9B6C9|nr:HdeA/HdeB family chaperone [Roseiarcaceae bacterium H3SJ34-1]
MKKVIFATLVGMAAINAPAYAQVTYDMSKATCADLSAMDPATQRDISAWISGWFNQRAKNSSLNIEGYQKNVASVTSWCSSNPGQPIMAALQASVANAKQGSGGPTTIDTAQITCSQLLDASLDEQLLLTSWMGGWFMSSKNLTKIDMRYAHRNSDQLGVYCKKHKRDKVITALQKTWK